MRSVRIVAVLVIASLLAAPVGAALAAIPQASGPETTERAREAYGRLPLAFEENRGQTHPDVKFIARGAGYAVFVTGNEMVVVLPSGEPRASRRAAVVRMSLVGGNPDAVAAGREPLPGAVNYLVGRDRTTWRTNVPRYARVELADVYPGVSMVYYGDGRRLEYDLVVAPGADPRTIRLAFDGADRLWTDTRGDLVLATAAGELRMHAPVTYQVVGGHRRPIASAYVVSRADDGRTEVGVQVAAWDRRHPLVIDPVLSYATYLGGAGADSVSGIAVDGDGNAYVTGNTFSTNFPTRDALQDESFGGSEAFVTKLDPSGTALVYSTYFGGSGFDAGTALAVENTGKAYVTGFTDSDDLPVTIGAYQPFRYGGQDVFVVKLGPAGDTVEYSTYLGGSDDDVASAIAIHFGAAYVTGSTSSADFPVAGAFIVQSVHGGGTDAFVTRLFQDGSDIAWSTFLGGFDVDRGSGIKVIVGATISSVRVYVVGSTSSIDFPVTASAARKVMRDATTLAFVTKFSASTGAVAFSTYFGGDDADTFGSAIAVDTDDKAHIVGTTTSSSLPVTTGAYQTTLKGTSDAFVARLNPSGSAVTLATYLGGTGADSATAIALNRHNDFMWVTGSTTSTDFPRATGTPTPTAAFAVRLTPNNGGPNASTLLSGNATVSGNALAVDGNGNAYVAGHLAATDFATTAGAFQTASGGSTDGFVVRYTARANLRVQILGNTPLPATVNPGGSFTVTYRLWNPGDTPASPSVLKVVLGERQPVAIVAVPRVNVTRTATGSSSVVVPIPASQPAGTYSVKLCADALREVDEDDEGDNCAVSNNFKVVRPDLVVATVSRGTTTSVARGSTITMKTKIRNDGDRTAPASIVRFYLGPATVRSRSDVRLAETTSFASLEAGATSSNVGTNVLIPSSVAPGTYRIIACADGAGVIAEANEGNNCKASPTVNVTAPPLDARR